MKGKQEEVYQGLMELASRVKDGAYGCDDDFTDENGFFRDDIEKEVMNIVEE